MLRAGCIEAAQSTNLHKQPAQLRSVNQQDSGFRKGISVRRITELPELESLQIEGISFFDPFLKQFALETMLSGGEVHVAQSGGGNIGGMLLYDDIEKAGSIFTRSGETLEALFKLKEKMVFFSELQLELRKEDYLIYTIDMTGCSFSHRFSHEVSVAGEDDMADVLGLMTSSYSRINTRWIKIAIAAGEKCFIVRTHNGIEGVAWLSVVGGKGRLHSLVVSPQFRKQGVGTDLLFARLLWLRTIGGRFAFSEIAESNRHSRAIALSGGMRESGVMYQYRS